MSDWESIRNNTRVPWRRLIGLSILMCGCWHTQCRHVEKLHSLTHSIFFFFFFFFVAQLEESIAKRITHSMLYNSLNLTPWQNMRMWKFGASTSSMRQNKNKNNNKNRVGRNSRERNSTLKTKLFYNDYCTPFQLRDFQRSVRSCQHWTGGNRRLVTDERTGLKLKKASGELPIIFILQIYSRSKADMPTPSFFLSRIEERFHSREANRQHLP